MSPSGNAATADEPVIGQDGVRDGVRGVRARSPARIPLSLKLAYSAFMAVLVPVYLTQYGPTNFLYFCDIALILTLVGIWAESALLVSVCAVGLLAPQTLWVVDFAAEAAGTPLTGMTAYMFNRETSPFLRGLSLFHGWLPFLLVWNLVWMAATAAILAILFHLDERDARDARRAAGDSRTGDAR